MQLMALASGTGVTYHRYAVEWDTGEKWDEWGQGTGDEHGPGRCVPLHHMWHFMPKYLPVWLSWPQEKHDLCRLIIGFINLSDKGYLENRLMEIWQAWEILAKEWGPDIQLSPEESELKKRVKKLARDWRKEYPSLDSDGKWCERLTFSFRWPQARKQIEDLIANRKLDISKVGLDLVALKKARDSIAHTGKMPPELYTEKRLALRLLQRAQLGLQLILLSELGYSELVDTEKDGWRTLIPMSEFFLQQ